MHTFIHFMDLCTDACLKKQCVTVIARCVHTCDKTATSMLSWELGLETIHVKSTQPLIISGVTSICFILFCGHPTPMMFDFYLLSVYMKAESQPFIFKEYMSEIMPPNVVNHHCTGSWSPITTAEYQTLCPCAHGILQQTTRWGLKKQSHGQFRSGQVQGKDKKNHLRKTETWLQAYKTRLWPLLLEII